MLTQTQKSEIINILEQGGSLPPEYKEVLFPSGTKPGLMFPGKSNILRELENTPLSKPGKITTLKGVGEKDLSCMLIHDDNRSALQWLIQMKRDGNIVNPDGKQGGKLAYIDSPFLCGRTMKTKDGDTAYHDDMDETEFLNMMYGCLVQIRNVLADDGTVYLHLDYRMAHYVKVLMDEVFDGFDFAEITWVCGLIGGGKYYPKAHETILCYKAPGAYLSPVKGPVQMSFFEEETKPDTVWFGKEDIAKAHGDTPVGTYAYRQGEYTGYPTQKPESLLNRIIETSSQEGDWVIDCFAGSGTTLAAAEKLNRKWVGIDCGQESVRTIRKRLVSVSEHKNWTHLLAKSIE